MASVAVYQALQAKKWEKETNKKLITHSVWGQLSGNVNVALPGGNQIMKVPDSVFAVKSASFESGVYQTTVPWIGKISTMGRGGRQTLEGYEATVPMRYKNVHWNTQRQAVALEDESVEGSLAAFYQVGSEKTQLLENYFMELDDYNYSRAILDGADEYLTESTYWQNTSVTTPVAETLHPVWLVNGESGPVPWDSTYSTYETAVDDAIDGGSTSNAFDLDAADSIAFQAHRRLIPLSGKAGFKYVAIISDVQADQLTTGSSNAWITRFENAAARAQENKAISGAIGVWKDVLYIVNMRNPVWNLANAAGSKLVFVKPDTDSNTATSSAIASRVVKGSADAGTGTAELAMVLGKAAVGVAKIGGGVKYKGKKFDYDFTEGFSGMRKQGCERMAFFSSSASTQPVCDSSFVYTTATPAQTV